MNTIFSLHYLRQIISQVDLTLASPDEFTIFQENPFGVSCSEQKKKFFVLNLNNLAGMFRSLDFVLTSRGKKTEK